MVKYDSLLTNVGGAYDKSTGIFTAPYRGIYTISCSLLSSTSNYVHLDIMKNGKKISIVYSASGTNPHSAQTLQLLLDKGDNIWIQNHSGNKASLHDHGSYNLFSGVLITQIWYKGPLKVVVVILIQIDILNMNIMRFVVLKIELNFLYFTTLTKKCTTYIDISRWHIC